MYIHQSHWSTILKPTCDHIVFKKFSKPLKSFCIQYWRKLLFIRALLHWPMRTQKKLRLAKISSILLCCMVMNKCDNTCNLPRTSFMSNKWCTSFIKFWRAEINIKTEISFYYHLNSSSLILSWYISINYVKEGGGLGVCQL